MNRTLTSAAAALPLVLGIAGGFTSAPPRAATEVPEAGIAVVTRNSALRSGPSGASLRIGTVPEGETVSLLSHGHRLGYLRVQTQDEEVGWVSERNVYPVDESEVHLPAPELVAPSGPTTHLQVASGDFDGCPTEGNPSPRGSNYERLLVLNREKNRSAEPNDSDIDSGVTLAGLLRRSQDDADRWDDSKAAEIVGYVYRVIPGGKTETTNCRKSDPVHRDSHIELVMSPSDTDGIRRVIVEVTPRWRAAAAAQHVDWSTRTLQEIVEGKWVRVRGWLLFDVEHKSQAENTNPGGESNWRATAWEIHPVSSITIVQNP